MKKIIEKINRNEEIGLAYKAGFNEALEMISKTCHSLLIGKSKKTKRRKSK